MSLDKLIHKTTRLIDSQLDLIASQTNTQHNIVDQLQTTRQLADIAAILVKTNSLQEATNGQTETEEIETTKKVKKEAQLSDIFSEADSATT
jgi:hypothetical protein